MSHAVPPPDGRDILHGWKEIAEHLGCSVRSAQRWEVTNGLPVKRIPGPDGGPIVYASRGEVDDWRRQTAVQEDDDGDASSSTSSAATPVDHPSDDRRDAETPTTSPSLLARVGAPTLAVLVTLAAGLASGLWLGVAAVPAWTTPTEFAVEGAAVLARNASGRIVWRYPLEHAGRRPFQIPPESGAAIGDLDGDGTIEVAVPVSSSPTPIVRDATDMVLVFDIRGRLRWTIQPELRVRHRNADHTGPWLITAFAFSPEPSGRIWIAYGHHTGAPAFVLEVSSRGEQSLRYLQTGRVFALARWRTAGRDYLALGGEDLPGSSASLGILDLDAPAARRPTDDDNDPPTCDNCPTASPHVLELFPNSDVTRADFRTSGRVYAIDATSPDRLAATITNGIGPLQPAAIVTMKADMTIEKVALTEDHWAAHRAFEMQGRILHGVDQCPDAILPMAIRRWTPSSGWN